MSAERNIIKLKQNGKETERVWSGSQRTVDLTRPVMEKGRKGCRVCTERVWEIYGKSVRVWAPTHDWVKDNTHNLEAPLMIWWGAMGDPLVSRCSLITTPCIGYLWKSSMSCNPSGLHVGLLFWSPFTIQLLIKSKINSKGWENFGSPFV